MMIDIEELRGIAVVSGTTLDKLEYEMLIEQQRRIDKAIELINTKEALFEINSRTNELGTISYLVNIDLFKNELLKILKGEANE